MHHNTARDVTVSVLFNLLIIIQLPYRINGAPCPSVCQCDDNNVICSDKNLTDIPNDLPMNTVYLNMDNNNLRVLNLERLADLPVLQFLTMRDNRISKVEPAKFDLPITFEKLNLRSNCLKTLENSPLSTAPGLRYLDLSKNSLTSAEGIFKNLTNLVTLSLSDNALTGISNYVFVDTVNLEKLEIKNNNLKKIDLGTFNNLERLSLLDLSRNDISEITGSWQNSHLQILDLSQCQLTDIPSNLPPSLVFLIVCCNRLTTITKASLKNYNQLESLVLDHNQISSIESQTFLSLETLRDLDMSDNLLTVFPSFLPKSLRDINLDRNGITDLTVSSFHRLVYLTSLSLKNNKIPKLTRKPFSSLRGLKSLYMDGNPVKELGENDLAELRELEVLSLSHCPLERIDVRPLIKLKALKELHLAFITKNQVSFNAAVLEELPLLENLNLQGSPSLTAQVIVSSPALGSLQHKLKVLNIMNNHLTYLPTNLKFYLRNAQKIKLAGNPLNCNSYLKWLYVWMKEEPNKFPYRDQTICANPESVQGTPVHQLPENYFMSAPSVPFSALESFLNQELSTSVAVAQGIIEDLDYADDLIIYPVSDHQRDENCESDIVEEPRMSTDIMTGIFKYASSVNTVVIDVSSPREHTRSEGTSSTMCADCDTDINVTGNQIKEFPRGPSSTTEINHRQREENREEYQSNEISDDLTSNNEDDDDRHGDQINGEGTGITKARTNENNSPSSAESSITFTSKNNRETTQVSSTDIPKVFITEREPPHYLKVAAVIASSGAGLLAITTGSFLFFVLRKFGKKKKEQVPLEYPMENC